MSELCLSPEAEVELDDIWLHIARDSGNIEVATRVVERIADRFWLLAQHPYLGRTRNDLRPGLRSFTADEQVIIYRIEDERIVLILHIIHGAAISEVRSNTIGATERYLTTRVSIPAEFGSAGSTGSAYFRYHCSRINRRYQHENRCALLVGVCKYCVRTER